jgi:hypothetical protein
MSRSRLSQITSSILSDHRSFQFPHALHGLNSSARASALPVCSSCRRWRVLSRFSFSIATNFLASVTPSPFRNVADAYSVQILAPDGSDDRARRYSSDNRTCSTACPERATIPLLRRTPTIRNHRNPKQRGTGTFDSGCALAGRDTFALSSYRLRIEGGAVPAHRFHRELVSPAI